MAAYCGAQTLEASGLALGNETRQLECLHFRLMICERIVPDVCAEISVSLVRCENRIETAFCYIGTNRPRTNKAGAGRFKTQGVPTASERRRGQNEASGRDPRRQSEGHQTKDTGRSETLSESGQSQVQYNQEYIRLTASVTQ